MQSDAATAYQAPSPETQRDLNAQRLGEQGGETEAQDLHVTGCVIPREGEVQGDEPGPGREGEGPEGNACRGRGRLAQRRILCSRLPQLPCASPKMPSQAEKQCSPLYFLSKTKQTPKTNNTHTHTKPRPIAISMWALFAV